MRYDNRKAPNVPPGNEITGGHVLQAKVLAIVRGCKGVVGLLRKAIFRLGRRDSRSFSAHGIVHYRTSGDAGERRRQIYVLGSMLLLPFAKVLPDCRVRSSFVEAYIEVKRFSLVMDCVERGSTSLYSISCSPREVMVFRTCVRVW